MEIIIYYEGWGKKIEMGNLIQEKDGNIYFQYNKVFLSEYGNISPKELSNTLNYQGPYPDFLDNLPGIIYDCLPDGWGRIVMDRYIESECNINREEAHIFLKLLLLNDNSIGGLSFEPKNDLKIDNGELPDLLTIYGMISEFNIKTDINNKDLKTLMLGSASLNGARPKILCFYKNINGNIKISHNYFEGGEPYIIKFNSETEYNYSIVLEYIYMSFAKKIWTDTPDIELLEVKKDIYALAIKRFDRIFINDKYEKKLLHSLADALHTNFRFPSFNYDGFLKMTGFLTQSYKEVELAFERCVFNIIFGNKDDHTKNFSYIFNRNKKWVLSPAYDLTFNNGMNGHHQMDILGKTNNITYNDLIKLGKLNDIKNPDKIIKKIYALYKDMILYIHNNYKNIIPNDIILKLEENYNNFKIEN